MWTLQVPSSYLSKEVGLMPTPRARPSSPGDAQLEANDDKNTLRERHVKVPVVLDTAIIQQC